MPIPAVYEPIEHVPARGSIVDRLRGWIVDGTLAPGEFVRDSEIAASLGVSRTPVREALLQLEREGLIESTPKRWTRVTLLHTADLKRLYPVLIELEVLAARLAAERSVAGLADVEAAQQAFAELVERVAAAPHPDSAMALREADDRFHRAILVAADNAYVEDALRPLKVLARRFENLYFGRRPEIGRPSVADHEQILAALRRGDAGAAAQATRANWERSRQALDTLIM